MKTENHTHTHENLTKKLECLRPDIEQFPKGFTTQEQRKNGLVIFHFVIATYMFIALAIVCDDYFVPSLERISESKLLKFFVYKINSDFSYVNFYYNFLVIDLKDDVAGATLMAAGSSAPELATTIIALFIAKVLLRDISRR